MQLQLYSGPGVYLFEPHAVFIAVARVQNKVAVGVQVHLTPSLRAFVIDAMFTTGDGTLKEIGRADACASSA